MKEKLRGGHLWVVVLGLLGFAGGVDANRTAALVFWSDRDRFGGDVFIMQADGSGLRNLTNHPAHYSDITWIRGEGDTSVTPASWGIVKREWVAGDRSVTLRRP